MLSSLLLAFTLTSADAPGKVLEPVELRGVRREPVAAVFLSDDLAAIACAKSGTLILWDVKNGKIKQEYQVGKQLRGLLRFGNDELLLIDDKTDELIQLRQTGDELIELRRYSLPNSPISLCTFEDARRQQVAVASLWARQVTIWEREEQPAGLSWKSLVCAKSIELSHEPGPMVPVSLEAPGRAYPDTMLFVADAFGGKFSSFKPRFGNPSSQSSSWHNFGGLLFNTARGKLYFTNERLTARMPITADKLLSGNVITSHLTEFNLELEESKARLPMARTGPPRTLTYPIPGKSSGDPAGLAFVNQHLLVCLAGVDQVWVTTPEGSEGTRLSTGKRPRAIATRRESALVLGELDDSVTLIDLGNPAEPQATTTLLDPATANRQLTPAERGERLFFDARLSAGGMMSCHSCHTDGHTNGLLADTLGDNSHGTPKRVLTLRGTRMTDLWAWNGEMKTLQDNVHKSLLDTMHAPKIEPRDVDDIVSFLHTLPPVPPLKPKPKDAADAAQVARGEKIFTREGCAVCHVPPLTFTSHATYDVGMPDEKGLKKFNPPSLRGVGRLRRLFHDNRATSLRDVFETHGHQLKEPLPNAELADLVRYLESL